MTQPEEGAPTGAAPARRDREILLYADGPREWAALLTSGRIEDLYTEDARLYEGPRRGEVCAARVDRLAPGGRMAFVDLGDGRSGLLGQASGLEPGDRVLVQVDRYAIEGKAPRVREAVSVPGRWLVAVRGGEGVRFSRRIPEGGDRERLLRAVEEFGESMRVIVRTAARNAEEGELADEAEFLQDRIAALEDRAESGEARTLVPGPGPVARALSDWLGTDYTAVTGSGVALGRAIGDEATVDPEIWADEQALLEHRDLAGSIRGLLAPRAEIDGGGWISIEPTAAVVAVDVNTGARFMDRDSAEAMGCAAARAIPRELRLRGLGGIVVVDFPPVSERGDEIIGREMERALRQDSPGATGLGWTEAGLYEIIRSRDRRPLEECFSNGI